jgi:hypothetical protein
MDFDGFETLEFPIATPPADGTVYVLLYKINGREFPFYVGQTGRFVDRMGDYVSAQHAASTDFKVGKAIEYLKKKMNCQIIVKHKTSNDRLKEEKLLIAKLEAELKLYGSSLLNKCPGYDYKTIKPLDALSNIERFCNDNYR